MAATKHLHRYSSAAVAHLDELLDDALKATFPASDPVAISFELGVIRTRKATTTGFSRRPQRPMEARAEQ